MNDWFTIEKIDSGTYAISEYRHWEETHCYLLCGTDRALLIDTGLGISDIKAVADNLTSLPIMVATTHVHWDHIGGHKYFNNIAVHESEKDWLAVQFPIPLSVVKSNLTRQPCDFPKEFCEDQYQIFKGQPQHILHDEEIIDLGNRQVTLIHTPGHSPGHCCFYEPERKYLYSGDLVYKGCLDAFYPSTDPLQFWHSIQKIQHLPVARILPGHHQLFVSVDMIGKIEKSFDTLQMAGQLYQGAGVFDFTDFQIHI